MRTLQDAKTIAAQAAPPHAKRFYAHLRSFVRTLSVVVQFDGVPVGTNPPSLRSVESEAKMLRF